MELKVDPIERFENLYKTYKDKKGVTKYREKIGQMPVMGEITLVIDFDDLLKFDPELAKNMLEKPEKHIEASSKAVKNVIEIDEKEYVERVEEKGDRFFARFKNLPTTNHISLRKLRAEHIGKFIMVDGILTRSSEVKPQIIEAAFQCQRCGRIIVRAQEWGPITAPPICDSPSCGRKGPFNLMEDMSKFIDWQKIRIQERPEDLPPGQLPRTLDAILRRDLVDVARPGDRIAIVGLLRSNPTRQRGREIETFDIFLDTNYVDVSEKELEKVEITPDEEKVIIDLSKDEWIHQKVVASIAPSVFGNEAIKEAIALQLFAGVPKVLPDGMKIRGEPNVLLVGDPGTAKSVHGTEKIFVGQSNEDEIEWTTKSIGVFVDGLMETFTDRVISKGDTEILAFNESCPFYTQSLDHNSLEVRKTKILEVSRHHANRLVRIYTRSGRAVLATPDHSFTTIDDGHLQVAKAKDLRTGIYLPVARNLKLNSELATIDMYNEYSKEDLVATDIINEQTNLVDSSLISGRKAAKAANIAANTMCNILKGRIVIPSGSWLRRRRDTSWFPRWLILDSALGRIIGFYLAEGNVEVDAIRFTTLDESLKEVLEKDLKAIFGKASVFEKGVYICQASLAKWFKRAFRTGAKFKRLDGRFFATPSSFRRALLAAYFTGDGGIDKRGSAVTASTVSRLLAYHVSDLLSTFGIFATIRKRTITRGKYQGRKYYLIRVQGEDAIKYYEEIGFISSSKQNALEELVKRLTSRKRYQSRDVIPDSGVLLAKAAKELEIPGRRGTWTREFLAEIRGKKYRQQIGRKYLQKVVSRLQQFSSTDRKSDSLEWLKRLAGSDIFWDPIVKIETINDQSTVYDIGTGDGHFVLAEGNLIVHNSQILMYVARLAPRGLYTSGKGTTAAGLCISADSNVLLSDGAKSIREIVEDEFRLGEPLEYSEGIEFKESSSNLQVFHSSNLKLKSERISKVWRIKSPEKLIRITTRTGREVKVTPQTGLLSISQENGLVWVPSRLLKPKDRIAVAGIQKEQHLGHSKNYWLLKSLCHSDIFWDEVAEATEIPAEEPYVYDLTIPGSHNFIANGIVVHNTAAVLRDETGGMTLEAGALVLADRGVACLSRNSRIIVNNEIVGIESLFDENAKFDAVTNGQQIEICNLQTNTCSIDSNMNTIPSDIVRIRRKKYNGKMLEIQFASGYRLKLTPDHKLLDGDSLEWKEANKLKKGSLVAAPLKIPGNNPPLYIFDIIPDNWLVILDNEQKAELKKKVLETYTTLSKFNRKYGISRNFLSGRCQIKIGKFKEILKDLQIPKEWEHRNLKYGRKASGEALRVVEITPQLAYFLGFMFGDASVSISPRRSRIEIKQSVKNKKQIDKLKQVFQQFSQRTIGEYRKKEISEIKGRRVESELVILYINSNLVAYLYEFITKKSLKNLLKLPSESLKAFLAGCLDSDGCISVKHGKKLDRIYKVAHIEFLLSNNDDENQAVMLALRRLDCFGKLVKGKGIDTIQITGREDVKRLLQETGAYSVKNKAIPVRKHLVSSSSDKLPKDPVAKLASRIISSVNTSILQKKGIWSILCAYKYKQYQPSRLQLQKIRNRISNLLDEEIINRIDVLANRDYFLDRIAGIKTVGYNGYVYDLHVPRLNNFVCDGVFVHNCIDEFDKMNPQDRVAIHEAMEQQTISIAKAGIVATLNARTAILAAANPALGRYNPYRSAAENIKFPVTLLSRFDLIFIITDRPEEEFDKRISDHILDLHRLRSTEPPIEPEILRKYIAYAKRNVRPMISKEAAERLKQFYLEMRSRGEDRDSPVPITARQLEALIRLAEARARIALRKEVTVEDADAVIRLIDVSLRQVGIDKETGRYDIDTIMLGRPKSLRDRMDLVIRLIMELEKEIGDAVPVDRVVESAQEHELEKDFVERAIEQLIDEGVLYRPSPGFVKKV